MFRVFNEDSNEISFITAGSRIEAPQIKKKMFELDSNEDRTRVFSCLISLSKMLSASENLHDPLTSQYAKSFNSIYPLYLCIPAPHSVFSSAVTLSSNRSKNAMKHLYAKFRNQGFRLMEVIQLAASH